MSKPIDLRTVLERSADKRSLDLNLEDGGDPVRFLPPELWPQTALDAAEAARTDGGDIDVAVYSTLFGETDWERLVAFAEGRDRAVRILNNLMARRAELTSPE